MNISNSFKSKPATSIGLALGLILIVVFPLGLASYLVSFESIGSFFVDGKTCHVLELIIHDYDDNCISGQSIAEMLKSHQWWEAIAFFWTLAFTGLFLWWDLPEAYDELNKGSSGKWSHRLLIKVTGVMILSFLLYLWGGAILGTQAYITGLAAKVVLALTFVWINSTIVKRAGELLAKQRIDDSTEPRKSLLASDEKSAKEANSRLQKLAQIAAEFTALNRDIDRPTFLTLLVLLIWDRVFADKDIVDLEAFIAGASSVILITTAFSFGFAILGDASKKTE